MHGTYLIQEGCSEVLLAVLPTEITNHKTASKLKIDSNFDAFLQARSDHRTESSKLTGSFAGKLEYAKRGKGFGYYGRNNARLIVFKVTDIQWKPES